MISQEREEVPERLEPAAIAGIADVVLVLRTMTGPDGSRITMDELGALLGVSRQTIHHWRSGENKPSPLAIDRLRRLWNAFSTPYRKPLWRGDKDLPG